MYALDGGVSSWAKQTLCEAHTAASEILHEPMDADDDLTLTMTIVMIACIDIIVDSELAFGNIVTMLMVNTATATASVIKKLLHLIVYILGRYRKHGSGKRDRRFFESHGNMQFDVRQSIIQHFGIQWANPWSGLILVARTGLLVGESSAHAAKR